MPIAAPGFTIVREPMASFLPSPLNARTDGGAWTVETIAPVAADQIFTPVATLEAIHSHA